MPAGAVLGLVQSGLGVLDSTLGSKAKGKLAEKQGFQDTTNQLIMLRQQQVASQSTIAQQRIKSKADSQKYWIIGGGITIAIIIIGAILASKS
jgi:hypothetical protein